MDPAPPDQHSIHHFEGQPTYPSRLGSPTAMARSANSAAATVARVCAWAWPSSAYCAASAPLHLVGPAEPKIFRNRENRAGGETGRARPPGRVGRSCLTFLRAQDVRSSFACLKAALCPKPAGGRWVKTDICRVGCGGRGCGGSG